MTMKELESAALKLPTARRAKLAASLLASLDSADADEIEQLWVREADRRYQNHRRNRSAAIPAATALGRARESLR